MNSDHDVKISEDLFLFGRDPSMYIQDDEEQFWSIYYFGQRIDVDVGPV